jgi:membrane protein DedA with SNARE-associated domain
MSGSGKPDLPGVFHSLAPILDHYGYLAVGFLVLIENFGVPLPGETILIAAAVYAGAGQLNVVAVGVIGLAAAIVGDNLGYVLGRVGGRRLVLRFGRYVFLTEERFARVESFFERYGGRVVTVSRFVEGLRQANGIVAGTTGMDWLRFALFNALGATLWVGTWVAVGYVAGSHLDAVYSGITRYSLVVLGVLVVAAVAFWLIRRSRAGDRPESQ